MKQYPSIALEPISLPANSFIGQYKTMKDSKPKNFKPTLLKGKAAWSRQMSDAEQLQFIDLIQSGLDEQQASELIGRNYKAYRKQMDMLAKKARLDMRLHCFNALKGHVTNNATAAIFAARAKLGWQDKQEAEQNQAVEYVDLPDNEGREAWQKRQGKLGRIS